VGRAGGEERGEEEGEWGSRGREVGGNLASENHMQKVVGKREMERNMECWGGT